MVAVLSLCVHCILSESVFSSNALNGDKSSMIKRVNLCLLSSHELSFVLIFIEL